MNTEAPRIPTLEEEFQSGILNRESLQAIKNDLTKESQSPQQIASIWVDAFLRKHKNTPENIRESLINRLETALQN